MAGPLLQPADHLGPGAGGRPVGRPPTRARRPPPRTADGRSAQTSPSSVMIVRGHRRIECARRSARAPGARAPRPPARPALRSRPAPRVDRPRARAAWPARAPTRRGASPSACAASSANSGFPPVAACSRCSVGRGYVRSSRSRRIRPSEPRLTGPRRIVVYGTRSGSRAPGRRVTSAAIGSSRSRRITYASGAADPASSHWMSSIATSTGRRAASSRSAVSSDTPIAPGSGAEAPGSSRRSVIASARRRGGGNSSAISSNDVVEQVAQPWRTTAASPRRWRRPRARCTSRGLRRCPRAAASSCRCRPRPRSRPRPAARRAATGPRSARRPCRSARLLRPTISPTVGWDQPHSRSRIA